MKGVVLTKLSKRGKAPKVRPHLEPSSSLAYLLGALSGDGSVFARESSAPNRIVFGSVSGIFIENVAQAMQAISLRPKITYNLPPRPKTKQPYHRIQAASFLFTDYYRSWRRWLSRDPLMGHTMDFVRGFYEAEGNLIYGRKYGNHTQHAIRIGNTDEGLLDLVQELLLREGIESHLRLCYPDSPGRPGSGIRHRKAFWTLAISNKDGVDRFLAAVRPSIKCPKL